MVELRPRNLAIFYLLVAGALVMLLVQAIGPAQEWMQNVDAEVRSYVIGHRSPVLTDAADVLDTLGRIYVLAPIRILIGAVLVLRKRWWPFVAFMASVVASELLVNFLKVIYARPRPAGGLADTFGNSFPSGHAAGAAVTALMLVMLFVRPERRVLWLALGAIFALAMGLSRVYLSVHWLSDSITGLLIGAICAIGAALATETAFRSRTVAMTTTERAQR